MWYLKQLAENNYRLKERTDFNDYMNGGFTRADFWWDIQNDVMFWEKNEEFKTKFVIKIFPK